MFGSAKKEYIPDFELYDVHCHILPGVDDGARTMEDSMALLASEYGDGVRHIILTPHFRYHMFENRERDVVAAYEALRTAAAREFPDLELLLGCELHEHVDMPAHIARRDQLRMAGTDYVLVEFSDGDEPALVKERLYELVSNGYAPIMAHAERYRSISSDLELMGYLVGLGVKIQLNADSVTGRVGGGFKHASARLMEAGYVHLIGSDCHDVKSRPARLAQCAQYLQKRYGFDFAKKIMCDNPSEIVKERKL